MRDARLVLAVLAALAAVPLGAAGCGRPLLSAEIDVPEVRITQPAIAFDPVTVVTADLCALVPGCLQQTVGWDLGGEVPGLNERGVRVDVRLLEVDLHLAVTPPATGDLGAIRAVRVLVPGGPLLASYARPAAGPPPVDLVLSGNVNLNLGEWLTNGELGLRLEIDYDPASATLAPFTAEVTSAFSVVATLSYRGLL